MVVSVLFRSHVISVFITIVVYKLAWIYIKKFLASSRGALGSVLFFCSFACDRLSAHTYREKQKTNQQWEYRKYNGKWQRCHGVIWIVCEHSLNNWHVVCATHCYFFLLPLQPAIWVVSLCVCICNVYCYLGQHQWHQSTYKNISKKIVSSSSSSSFYFRCGISIFHCSIQIDMRAHNFFSALCVFIYPTFFSRIYCWAYFMNSFIDQILLVHWWFFSIFVCVFLEIYS